MPSGKEPPLVKAAFKRRRRELETELDTARVAVRAEGGSQPSASLSRGDEDIAGAADRLDHLRRRRVLLDLPPEADDA